MDLIIESGATKTDICLIDGEGSVHYRTSGINFAIMDMNTVSLVLRDAVSHLNGIACKDVAERVCRVHFYGAGLLGGGAQAVEMLHGIFHSAEIEAESDLVAAARAVCGSEPGIAAVLGTGSNSCLYDGRSVVKNVRPCGYVFGDYGSGNALGRAFLSDYFQGLVPSWLACDFRMAYGLDYASAVAAVYQGDAPARYLASFAPYVLSVARGHGHDGRKCDEDSRRYAVLLIKDNFRTFIGRCLKQYDTSAYGVGAVGSFGYAAGDFFLETAREENVRVVRILRTPMDGLAEYHKAHVQ